MINFTIDLIKELMTTMSLYINEIYLEAPTQIMAGTTLFGGVVVTILKYATTWRRELISRYSEVIGIKEEFFFSIYAGIVRLPIIIFFSSFGNYHILPCY